MDILILKLVLTPALIGLASLAGRRWGPAISGWLIGLPLTSGPVAFILALTYGAGFATTAAVGTLAGAISQTAFCLAYGWLALRFSWPIAVLAGSLAFFGSTALLQFAILPAVFMFLAAVAALALGLRLMPGGTEGALAKTRPPFWDIPARMVVATVFVVLLTGAASFLGPWLTGLLTPFPLYTAILAGFAHQQQGPRAAIQVLRGLLLGLFAFAGFFLVLVSLLQSAGIPLAFMCAIVTALAIQGGSLIVLRRMLV